MTTPQPRPRPPTAADDFSPESITDAWEDLPDRTILYAPEGWGKTSFGAEAPGAVFLMTRGEDGVKTLKRTGQVPPTVRHYPRPAERWHEALRALSALIVQGGEPGTLVVDTLNGLERLCFEEVCASKFKGDWMDFDSWARGPKACIPEWQKLLEQLDRLRQLGWAVTLLAHAAVEKVPNPDGPDFDRWQPAMDRKYLWPLTHKWADLILFGGFETWVNKEDKKDRKGKATGGTGRVLRTQPSATCCAKNRHGLPAEVECGGSAVEAWAAFQVALHPGPEAGG